MLENINIFSILKRRWNSPLRRKTIVDFLAHISSDSDIPNSLLVLIGSITVPIGIYLNLSFGQVILFAAAVYITIATVVSVIDTYYKRRQRIQQRAVESVEIMLGSTQKRRFW